MSRLLAVELTRFRSRQAIVLLALAGALVGAVLVGVVAWDSRPLTEADRSDAVAQARLEAERPEMRAEVAACEEDPTAYLGPGATASACAETLVPPVENYYPRQALDLSSVLHQTGLHLAVGIVALMVIAGSTFAGADWGSRTITNQLLFEPRRLRLWAAKAIAVTLSCGVVALVVLGGFWLAIGSLAQAQDVAISGADATEVTWHVVRAVLLAMAAALGSFALTMVFRHTVATLALLFVYSVVGEILVGVLPWEGAGRYALGNNVYGWLAERHRYFDPTISCAPREDCTSTPFMSHLQSGLFLSALLVLTLLVSAWLFRRRDV